MDAHSKLFLSLKSFNIDEFNARCREHSIPELDLFAFAHKMGFLMTATELFPDMSADDAVTACLTRFIPGYVAPVSSGCTTCGGGDVR